MSIVQSAQFWERKFVQNIEYFCLTFPGPCGIIYRLRRRYRETKNLQIVHNLFTKSSQMNSLCFPLATAGASGQEKRLLRDRKPYFLKSDYPPTQCAPLLFSTDTGLWLTFIYRTTQAAGRSRSLSVRTYLVNLRPLALCLQPCSLIYCTYIITHLDYLVKHFFKKFWK